VSAILCSVNGPRAEVRLSLPKRSNALDEAAIEALYEALLAARADPSWRVLVISAEGDEFCRGLDLERAFESGGRPSRATLERFSASLLMLASMDRPTIAHVEGAATGGGVGLAAACELVIASERATFTLPELLVGMIPALIAPFLLRRLGPRRFVHLATGARTCSSHEALAIGLADQIGELEEQVARTLRTSKVAADRTKSLVMELESARDLQEAARISVGALDAWLDRTDVREGLNDFASGLAPKWWRRD
jgi:enoyl-CoA hydratase/carnithine racemase